MNAQAKIEATGVHAAIAAAMADVKPLAKEDHNAHGGYKFAGIDAFLDLTRPICARHGLTILQDEEGFEVIEIPTSKGMQKSLLMRFAFTVAKDGESIGPLHRSIMVPASMGSQAFGSGQSYALKQFLRSLFQISTGEKDDIDHHDTGELAVYKPVEPPASKKPVNWGGRYPTKTALKQAMHKHHAELERLGIEGSHDDLEDLLTSPEYQDYIEQATEHAPAYLDGPLPESAPPEFIQTFKLEQKARDMIALRGGRSVEREVV